MKILRYIFVHLFFLMFIASLSKALSLPGPKPYISTSKYRYDESKSPKNNSSISQIKEWVFYNMGNTGLPDYSIWRVLVDDYDNIWAGTEHGGLVKFDGEVWTVYTKDNSWLPGNYISALAKDNYGNIWIGTSSNRGLAKFDGKNWRVYIPANSQVPDETITSIVFDSNNAMWFSTNGGSLVKVEGLSVSDEPEWTFYDQSDFSFDPNSTTDYITSLALDDTGCLWMGTLESDLVSFDGSSFTIRTAPFSIVMIKTVAIDSYDDIWVVDFNNTLCKFDGTNWELIEPEIPPTPELPGGFPYEEINSLAVDNDSILWIGTDGGFILYDGDEWSVSIPVAGTDITSSIAFSASGEVWAGSYSALFSYDGISETVFYTPYNTGLPGNDIVAVKTDDYDNIWTGDRYNGLAMFDGIVWEVFNELNSGLPDNSINVLEKDEYNNIWIGTDNGLAVKQAIALPEQEWIVYTPDNSALPARSIRCLNYSNGFLRIGTALGLTRFDGDTWVTFNTDNSGLPHNDVRSTITDKDGNTWIGTYGGGICKIPALSLNPYNWQSFSTVNSDMPDNIILTLAADSQGILWIGTANSGLVKYDGTDFTVYNTENSNLPDNHVEFLKLDADENIWIGTRYNGVAKFDRTSWTLFNSFSSELPEGPVYSIDVDENDNVWIAIDGGGLAVYNGEGVVLSRNLSLSGQLFCESGMSPLNAGIVELYRLGNTEYTAQMELSGNNEYEFTGIESGQYTIKVIPDTLIYPQTLPTWMGYKLALADASYVSLNKNLDNQNITVIQRSPEGNGPGTVTGSLIDNLIGKNSGMTLNAGKIEGNPVVDCYVYLFDPASSALKAFDITSVDGKFIFNNLSEGEYVFYADYKGLHMNLANPVLKIENNNDSLGIDAIAGIEDIKIHVGIVSNIESLLTNDLKVYPVPAKYQLIIESGFLDAYPDIEAISIIDLSGKVLYNDISPFIYNSRKVIDISRFLPGMYLLKIQVKRSCYLIKIIKK
ncbi:MAG: T9SS type A sorting domain-containing protein [Bacteroidales bacterium]|nr:T9SS type A sorting domain-containing protein [Bacteroidales bacterium]